MMEFAQFVSTPVPLNVAAALVNGNSRVLKFLQEGGEVLLSTCAKLKWDYGEETFYVFSYAFDGSDGKEAVESVM